MQGEQGCQAADFFVLRTPSLPIETLKFAQRESLREEAAEGSSRTENDPGFAIGQVIRALARREDICEALSLASPEFTSRIPAWLDGTLKCADAQRMERTLLKYLSRMSFRSTPFGLFAAVSLGTWSGSSHLRVDPWPSCRKAMRWDWGLLERLVEHLEKDPSIRWAQRYQVNSTLRSVGGFKRYIKCLEDANHGRTYHLEAVESTPHLDYVLEETGGSNTLEDLSIGLSKFAKVTLGEARNYLDGLVNSQILRGELHPPLTHPHPIEHLARIVQTTLRDSAYSGTLIQLALELRALASEPIGSRPQGYHWGVPSLRFFETTQGYEDYLHVDQCRPAPGLALSPTIRRALEEGIDLLNRLSPSPKSAALDRFKAGFQQRYGRQWVPLLEALDEESGIGFDGGPLVDSPLIGDLPFHAESLMPRITERDLFLMSKVLRQSEARRWDLDDDDVQALTNPDHPPIPHSFAALVSLEATNETKLDKGDFSFFMDQYSGPSAARLLGRFSWVLPELEPSLLRILGREEENAPDVIFAEIIHAPKGREGNVVSRPALRDYEIPVLSATGATNGNHIPPKDLLVSIQNDRVVLISSQTGREVVPRLSSAHNYARGPALYRFLACLQDQDQPGGGWSWGVLSESPFLPRVTRGRHVLSKARWRLQAKELKQALVESAGSVPGAFRILRDRRGLPRKVIFLEADNALLMDLDQDLWTEILYQMVSQRTSFTLVECFPDPEALVVASSEGRFMHEIIVPFERAEPRSPEVCRHPSRCPWGDVPVYSPGSEWLYLKLYGGQISADRLLIEFQTFLSATERLELWDRWHFVRYQDPSPHIRLRLHGRPQTLLAQLLPKLHDHFESCKAEGLMWKWEIDTFRPEWERYGGPEGFALADAWFFEDSSYILDQLTKGIAPEERWKAGLTAIDAIWGALGFDLATKRDLADTSRMAFRNEFAHDGSLDRHMGISFRKHRREAEQALEVSPTWSHKGLNGLYKIQQAIRDGLVHQNLRSMALNLSHMHLNRLFRKEPREQEWVIMDYLMRLYDSVLARTVTR